MKKTKIKMKRQPLEWEKILTNKATDQKLISKIYKQLMHLKSEKWKIWLKKKKWQEDLNRHFSKNDMQMANNTWKMLNITHY